MCVACRSELDFYLSPGVELLSDQLELPATHQGQHQTVGGACRHSGMHVCACIDCCSELEFYLSPGVELLSDELELRLRCQRLVAAGVWVAKQFPR